MIYLDIDFSGRIQIDITDDDCRNNKYDTQQGGDGLFVCCLTAHQHYFGH